MSTLKGEKYEGVFARVVLILEHAECAKRRTISVLMGNGNRRFLWIEVLDKVECFCGMSRYELVVSFIRSV